MMRATMAEPSIIPETCENQSEELQREQFFFQHRNKILVCYESVSIARAGWVGGGERESKYLLLRGNRTPQHPLHSRAKCEPDPNYQNKSFLASSSLRRRLRSARPSSTSRSISPRIRGLSRNRVTDAAIFLRAPWNTHF